MCVYFVFFFCRELCVAYCLLSFLCAHIFCTPLCVHTNTFLRTKLCAHSPVYTKGVGAHIFVRTKGAHWISSSEIPFCNYCPHRLRDPYRSFMLFVYTAHVYISVHFACTLGALPLCCVLSAVWCVEGGGRMGRRGEGEG